MNDPDYRIIGVGTRIFLGGGTGYVIDQGTQHNPTVGRNDKNIPKGGAGTLALMGDMKGMNTRYVRGVSFTGYGPSLAVGIGVPIPVLDEEVAQACSISDAEIHAPVWDYSEDYPGLTGKPIKHVSYAELRSGHIEIEGKKVETAALSSISRAREIASALKEQVAEGKFTLSEPVQPIANSKSGLAFKGLEIRPLTKSSKGARR
jgi:uncharacterized protein (DUF39 family)